MMIRWWEHGEKGVTDGQTDRQTDWISHIAAWSQLKICKMICIRSFLNQDKHISQPLYRSFTNLQYLTRIVQRNLVKSDWNETVFNFIEIDVWPTRSRGVFPWGGISVIFSFGASISRISIPSHEIEFWLDFRYVNRFTKNYKPFLCIATPASKWSKLPLLVDGVRVRARVKFGLVSNYVFLSWLLPKIAIQHRPWSFSLAFSVNTRAVILTTFPFQCMVVW